MSKRVVVAIALALVLVGGVYSVAQAACCLPSFNFCGLWSCASHQDRDIGDYNPYPQRVHSLGVINCCGEGGNMDTGGMNR